MDIKSLNDRQKNAVLTIGGPMLVFAGAGSGKTRVLTYKIAYLIQEIGMLPENILAVTFTNKAAQEMKSRVHDLVDVDLSGITIGTFHSIGAMILRREIGRLGWDSNFTIYDQTDSKSLVKNIIKDLNLDLKMYDPKSTLIKISIAKNSMQSFETLIRSSKNIHEEKIAQIYKEYEQSLKGNNCLDFDDLLVKPLDLFNQFPEVLAKYQNKFKYILVDEYQDTNKPQFEFIKLLSELHKDVFAVGDDDQSIYGWRGADISNILNFQNTYADSKIVKFAQTFYSDENLATILDGNCPEGFDPEDKLVSRQMKSLSRTAPIALRMASDLIDAAGATELSDGLSQELGKLEDIFSTDDALEGLSALIEGRKPTYQNS